MADHHRGGSDDRDGRQEMDRGRDRATRGRDLERGRGYRDRDRYEHGGAWRGDDLSGMYGYEGEGWMRGGNADFGNRSEYRGGRGDRESGEFSGYGGRGMARGERGSREGYQGAGVGGVDFNRGSSERGGRGWNGRDDDRGDLATSAGYRPTRESFRGRGPKGYQRSDERIREEVCEILTHDHDVDASEIEVNVQGGVVTLSGSVNDRWAKRRAEDIVESVSGVKDVENQIRVGSGLGQTDDPAVRHSE